MKKLMIFLMALLIAAPGYADLQKELSKEINKEYKKKLKDLKKENWKVMGSHSLEVSLLKHYIALNDMDAEAKEVIGMSVGKTKNNSYQSASNNAMIHYAASAGGTLKGRVMSDIFSDGSNPDEDFDKFFSTYERMVEKEIKSEMEESFAIIRQRDDKAYEVEIYYIVNEDKAQNARMRALDKAMRESEAMRKYADQLNDFAREGVSD